MKPIFCFSRTSRSSRRSLAFVAAISAVSISCAAGRFPITEAQAQTAMAEQEAHVIAVDAYVYLYPLVIMDLSRRQFTNIEPGKEVGKGPMNMFVNVAAYPPGDFKGVVRPNFDTLYSIAWLDLTKEPLPVTRVQGLPSLTVQ